MSVDSNGGKGFEWSFTDMFSQPSAGQCTEGLGGNCDRGLIGKQCLFGAGLDLALIL